MAHVVFATEVLQALDRATVLFWTDAPEDKQAIAWSETPPRRLEDRVLVLLQSAIEELIRRATGVQDDLEPCLANLARQSSQLRITVDGPLQPDSPAKERFAASCEAFADALLGITAALEILEAGVAQASSMKRIAGIAVRLQGAVQTIRHLAESSVSHAKCAISANSERLILDLHCLMSGLLDVYVRGNPAEWVLQLFCLPACPGQGLILLRDASSSPFACLRLVALYALWYQHIIVADEFSCLGMSAAAADAAAEAFHLERALMNQFPTVARLGTAQFGLHLLLDAPKAGSHRLDSRLHWTLVGEHGAWGDLGPGPIHFEDLAADAEERNCTFRLRAAWEAVLLHLADLNFKELEDLLRLVLDDARCFVGTSEVARGCVRNGGMLLAVLEARHGRVKARDALLDEVEGLGTSVEVEGRVRTSLRCQVLRARPATQTASSVALTEDMYRYNLLARMRDKTALVADLSAICRVGDDGRRVAGKSGSDAAGDESGADGDSSPRGARRRNACVEIPAAALASVVPASSETSLSAVKTTETRTVMSSVSGSIAQESSSLLPSPAWVSPELEMAGLMWLGVIARVDGKLEDAQELLREATRLAEKEISDSLLSSIPHLYHAHIGWAELMCVHVQREDWTAAESSRRNAQRALEREARRGAARATETGGWTASWTSLAECLAEKMSLPLTPVHALHPRCPLFFWQAANVLQRAASEITAHSVAFRSKPCSLSGETPNVSNSSESSVSSSDGER
eukprot:TRINITY_DN27300_c0_g1_i1.p1 TRINITY_DN27300_c0_g1~~TRINITY_DN27300_c0_g1_i1.p1  ORF type:complete len:781 (-),score=122.34 TRINITY_DN27300_c0_g1_i1:136-2379(-)